MKFNKIFFVICLVICMFSVSSAFASEINGTDLLATDDGECMENEDILLSENDDLLNANSKSFTDLNNDIVDKDNVNLSNDYTFNSDVDGALKNGIKINRDMTIYGNGITIDGSNSARAFNIGTNNTVVIRDITFINCNVESNGGAVCGGKLINCTFKYNYASYSGGATYNSDVEDCTFIGNSVYYRGGGAIYGGSALNCIFKNNCGYDANGGAAFNSTVINCTFSNNRLGEGYHVGGSGGAVFMGHAINSTFISNVGKSGGAVYLVDVLNCTFKDNHAYYVGGAVCGGSVKDSSFDSNFANSSGGAIYNAEVFNSAFNNNHASLSGGAVCCKNVINCTFTNNYLNNYDWLYNANLLGGGAVHNATIINCTFTNNKNKYHNGGAISQSTAVNCTFSNNYAEYGGAMNGGIAVSCTFQDNSANYGGAICDGNVYNSLLEKNYARYDGGAVFSSIYFDKYGANSNIRAVNCTFNNNNAKGYGGAVYNAEVSTNSKFKNNKDGNGKDLYNTILFEHNENSFSDLDAVINGNNNSEVYLSKNYTFDFVKDSELMDGIKIDRDVTIHGNGVVVDGSYLSRILKVFNSDVVIHDVIFINGKTLGHGGAINGNCTLMNCTFIKNYANRHGGAIYGCTAVNCTFNSNGAEYGVIDNSEAINCTFKHNLAIYGGAAFNSIVTNGSFIENAATGVGSAIYYCIVNNCYFDSNVALTGWATVYNENSISDSDYIYNENYGKVIDSTFVNNIAETQAGAIYGGYVLNCTFINNHVLNTTDINDDTMHIGGAVCYADVVNSTFINNKVDGSHSYGGAMAYGSAINCTFKDNLASYGGAVYDVSAVNCKFIHNQARVKGGATYEGNVTNCTFENNKLSTKVTSAAVTAVYNGNKYLTVTLKDIYGKVLPNLKVVITLNGHSKTIKTDKNGKVKLSTNNLAPKSYSAKIEFKGDADHVSSSTTVKVVIKKATPKLTAKSKSFKKSVKTKKYSVTLKTNQNKAMKNTKVTIKVNKKSYSAKTNSKGVATFKITKLTKKGKYTATIKYGGSKYYNAKSVKSKITIK